MKEMYAMISTQNLACNVTIIYKFEAQGIISDYRGVETFGLVSAGDTDTTFISAAVIYKLLKQFYCDAGCFPNNLTQSIYESVFKSVFQSVPRFSHVHSID